MKLTFITDSRDLIVPAGFESELQELIKEAERNKYLVKIVVENLDPIRTNAMNDKFHAMCRELAEKASDGSESSVEFIKDMAKSMATEYYGYPQLEDNEGRLQFDADGRPRGMSTARATSKQFTMLMDSLRMIADEFGYEWREE